MTSLLCPCHPRHCGSGSSVDRGADAGIEAKNDEKALKTAIKQVSSTEKEERNAFKAKHSATEVRRPVLRAIWSGGHGGRVRVG